MDIRDAGVLERKKAITVSTSKCEHCTSMPITGLTLGYSILLFLLASPPIASPSFASACSSGTAVNHTVNNSLTLLWLASSKQPFNCAVINITTDSIRLSGNISFASSVNLSIVGQPHGTKISCEQNDGGGGLQFLNSHLIRLVNLNFTRCSMTIEVEGFPNLHVVVYFHNSSSIWMENCHYVKNAAIGLMLSELTGNSTITHSGFIENGPLATLSNFTYGGMFIYRNSSVDKANYTIDNCLFSNNRNNYSMMLGGGMTVHLNGCLNGSSIVNILNSNFINNSAQQGGALCLNQFTGPNNTVNVGHTNFVKNLAKAQGGGIWIRNSNESSLSLNLHHCVFDSNYASWCGGLGVYVATGGPVNVTASYCNWTRNGADTSGYAVGLFEEQKQCNPAMYALITATFTDCHFYSNTLKNFDAEIVNKGAIGVVYGFGSKFIFRGYTTFSHNYGSAIYLRESANATFDNCSVIFHSNVAQTGGAIRLESSSVLHLTSNAKINFTSNSATLKGGAIYQEHSTSDKDAVCCVFDFLCIFKPNESSNEVWFIDNHADNFKVNQSIHVGGLVYKGPDICIEGNTSLLLQKPLYYSSNDSTRVLFDASSVKLNSSPPIFEEPNNSLRVMPGEIFYLVPTIVDKLGHNTVTSAYLSLTYNDDDEADHKKFTYIGPSYMGLDNYTKHNSLYITRAPDVNVHDFNLSLELYYEKHENGYRDGYLRLKIELIDCKLGFLYDNDTQVCKCFKQNVVDNLFCPNTSIACIRNGYWHGKVSGDTVQFDLLLCDKKKCDYENQICPTAICPNDPDYCMLRDDESDLCFQGRGGVLCSHCEENYAFTFSAYRCVRDTCNPIRSALLMVGIFLYWAFMILLFFIILSLNLSSGSGFASGIIYYFSVVFLLTDSIVTNDNMLLFLSLSVSVTQLSPAFFGHIPICFARSLDSELHHIVFQYITPVFVVATILAIILFSRRCKCPKRISLAENSPIHAICLLILISYTYMTYTNFQILRPIEIRNEMYVYADPEIPYFHKSKHLPYAVLAIFFEVFISLPICLLLLLAPCLTRSRRVNLVKLKLKPIVDEFQACYKDEHRWFAGFYFLARQLMYLSIILPQQVLPQSNSLIHCICALVLMVQATIQPYKMQFWYLNIIDNLLLTDILLLSLFPVNSYVNTINLPVLMRSIQKVAPYVLTLLPSLYVFGIITLLIVKHLQHIWSGCRKVTVQESSASINAISADTESYEEGHRDDEICRDDLFSDPFYQDSGEREPLLSEDFLDDIGTYSAVGGACAEKEEHKFTTTSLRVSNLRRFPPAPKKESVTN